MIFGREFRSGFFDGSRIDRTERRAIGVVQRFKHLIDLAGGDRKGLDVFLLSQRSEGRSADHSNRHGFRLIQRLLCDLFLVLPFLLSRLSSLLGRCRRRDCTNLYTNPSGRALITIVRGFFRGEHRWYRFFWYFRCWAGSFQDLCDLWWRLFRFFLLEGGSRRDREVVIASVRMENQLVMKHVN